MTRKEKDLLLRDLCGRLSYKVMVECSIGSGESIDLVLNTSHIDELINNSLIIKPYLRPMSSMTRGEQKELEKIIDGILSYKARNYFHSEDDYTWNTLYEAIDWLIANHFDYRGLIPMGLALESKPGMYNN